MKHQISLKNIRGLVKMNWWIDVTNKIKECKSTLKVSNSITNFKLFKSVCQHVLKSLYQAIPEGIMSFNKFFIIILLCSLPASYGIHPYMTCEGCETFVECFFKCPRVSYPGINRYVLKSTFYTLSPRSPGYPPKYAQKNDAIFSIYRKNGIIPWFFF